MVSLGVSPTYPDGVCLVSFHSQRVRYMALRSGGARSVLQSETEGLVHDPLQVSHSCTGGAWLVSFYSSQTIIYVSSLGLPRDLP